MYLLYVSGSSLTINLAISPSSIIFTVPSMSAFIIAPGMSVKMTYLLFLALIAQDNIIASSDNMGELASSFAVNSLCSHLSSHACISIVPSYFSFRNINYLSAFVFSSYLCNLFKMQ